MDEQGKEDMVDGVIIWKKENNIAKNAWTGQRKYVGWCYMFYM